MCHVSFVVLVACAAHARVHPQRAPGHGGRRYQRQGRRLLPVFPSSPRPIGCRCIDPDSRPAIVKPGGTEHDHYVAPRPAPLGRGHGTQPDGWQHPAARRSPADAPCSEQVPLAKLSPVVQHRPCAKRGQIQPSQPQARVDAGGRRMPRKRAHQRLALLRPHLQHSFARGCCCQLQHRRGRRMEGGEGWRRGKLAEPREAVGAERQSGGRDLAAQERQQALRQRLAHRRRRRGGRGHEAVGCLAQLEDARGLAEDERAAGRQRVRLLGRQRLARDVGALRRPQVRHHH
eukprot:scaffold5725_cov210-Isochrysis_galbana.AAC.1